MRSAASLSGHPVHPMLVSFPIAFLTGALLFDVVGVVGGIPELWRVGAWLAIAGVAAAVVTAVPGFIDYFRAVPPDSTGKQRALRHAAANLVATVLFAIAWLLRDGTAQPGVPVLALEAIGAALLAMGGWMGGTLVFRNQIGVDHRYAGAGKWQHERLAGEPNAWVTVARSDDLKLDQMKLLEIGGRRIVLARAEAGYVAFDDRCPHRGGPLADGVMMCGRVQCPWHGSQFDVHTGQVKAGPAECAIATYRVEQTGADVRLLIPDRA